uniref:Uncharacterized protein n=1 Tax=Timema cristinae TaxID=61476 RepID=A0A7R9CQ72_TIMCR|nr:unnamed protein product [Timema cristinae]
MAVLTDISCAKDVKVRILVCTPSKCQAPGGKAITYAPSGLGAVGRKAHLIQRPSEGHYRCTKRPWGAHDSSTKSLSPSFEIYNKSLLRHLTTLTEKGYAKRQGKKPRRLSLPKTEKNLVSTSYLILLSSGCKMAKGDLAGVEELGMMLVYKNKNRLMSPRSERRKLYPKLLGGYMELRDLNMD